ncbi:MAG: dihydropteroate synthase [Gammaproteobacteria bacterium RIFCSPLOWO2_02_FULL_56_15]|nr:MAG: dihydropteroate synthase [Gammaproteobacteria bacterium RIFCSPLOWO2_02_FULL_56_15]
MEIVPDCAPQIMGILNITPDSFSDGGDFIEPSQAVEHALGMERDGADIIDIGGESTRPGASRVTTAEQLRRVLPVIAALRSRLKEQTCISIDTTRAEVAERAIMAGVTMINDISAGEEDPSLFTLAAEKQASIVLMHKQGIPASMQENPDYADLIREIRSYLLDRAALAIEAGVSADRIILDPGIGFGKTVQHNLQLLANLADFTSMGFPLLLGASRKTTLAVICGVEDKKDLVGATCATTAAGVLAGVRILRVHDVKENRQAADVAWAIRQQHGISSRTG